MEPTLPRNVEELYTCAYRLYAVGLYADAEHFFQLLIALDTTQFHHWMGLGSCLQMQRKYKEAVDAYASAALLEASEKDPFPHARAAECLYTLGEKNRAFQALKAAKLVATKDQKYDALIKQLNFLEERWVNHGRNP